MGAATQQTAPGGGAALVYLYFLRMRASLRRMRRSVATPKGIIFAIFGLCLVVLWLGSLLARGLTGEVGDPAEIRGYVPYALVFFLLMALLTSAGERAIYFSPAEVNLLFSGPFSRRQLVLYKIGTIAMGIMLTSLFFAIFLFAQVGSFLAAYLGAFASLLLVQLVSMFMVMLSERAGQQLTVRLRWVLGLGTLILLGSGLSSIVGSFEIEDPQGVLNAVRSGPGGRILEGILAPYTWTVTAPTAGILALSFMGAMAINAAIVGAILVLDANYLERAAGVSERMYSNMRRAQRTGVAAANPKRAGRRVVRLPHWGGVGTMAWRQLTTARRSSMGTVIIMLVMAVGVSIFASSGVAGQQLWGLTGMMVLWLTLILSGVLRFDFRGDLDVLETLKAMPFRPIAISAGQIVVPTAVLTGVQTMAVAAPLALQGHAVLIPLVALFAIPVNGLLYAVENLMFLLYPVRMQGQTSTDFSFLGRQVLVFFVKMIVITGCVTIAASIGGLVYVLSGMEAAGFVVAWCVLCAELIAILPYLGWAFQRFDPSQGVGD